MRLRTDIWVKAYLRRCQGEGASGVVVRHGDDDAGAVYIKVRAHDGRAEAYAPAPAGWEVAASERRFVLLTSTRTMSERELDEKLARESEFDPDVWIIEVEDREGRHFLEGWLDDSLDPRDA